MFAWSQSFAWESGFVEGFNKWGDEVRLKIVYTHLLVPQLIAVVGYHYSHSLVLTWNLSTASPSLESSPAPIAA